MNIEKKIFKSGSNTFYISSLSFPRSIRRDVFDLYSFLRVVDDYVDQSPPDQTNFYYVFNKWSESLNNPNFTLSKYKSDTINDRVIKNIIRLSRKYNFDPVWLESFFTSMQSDLQGCKYKKWQETLSYMYGSAEVVGLMMAKIMNLNSKAYSYAALQGRALQMINFIRDIEEDNKLGRRYFPIEELRKFNLLDLTRQTAQTHPQDFTNFIHAQIERYKKWQAEAQEGYKFIPKQLGKPLDTSINMYLLTLHKIAREPHIIFE